MEQLLLIDTDDVLILHDVIQTNLLTSGVLCGRSPHDRVLELFGDLLVDGWSIERKLWDNTHAQAFNPPLQKSSTLHFPRRRTTGAV